jgi:acetylglutamate kinase
MHNTGPEISMKEHFSQFKNDNNEAGRFFSGGEMGSHLAAYTGNVFVIKYGGASMIEDELQSAFADDVLHLQRSGIHLVIVHGGGNEITTMAGRLGLQSVFIDGMRYTDTEMMNTVQMVLAGKTNKEIVSLLNLRALNALGLSGIDLNLLRARKLPRNGKDYGYVGTVTSVNTGALKSFLAQGILPVIAPIGSDEKGTVYNINADAAAASIAESLQADKLIYISDIPGVYAHGHLLPRITFEEAEKLIEHNEISAGMIPKVRSAFAALRNQVKAVNLIDGRVPHQLLKLFMPGSISGTEFVITAEPKTRNQKPETHNTKP